MRRALALFVLSACTIGPKLVTVPMLESAPTLASASVEPDSTNVLGDDDTSYAGSWEGRAYQRGNTWPLTVTFERPARTTTGADLVAHVYYADQRCRADWKLHSTEARHWQGEESLTANPTRRCADHGRVSLDVLDEDTMNWRWTAGSDTATATLERAQQ